MDPADEREAWSLDADGAELDEDTGTLVASGDDSDADADADADTDSDADADTDTDTDADADADADADTDADADADGTPDAAEEDGGLIFRRVILARKKGASWLAPVDLDGDGFKEYLLTSMTEGLGFSIPPIGPGGAYVMSRDGGAPSGGFVGTWSLEEGFDYWDGIIWPNQSTVFDINNDGTDDWVIGCGFLPRPEGNILWMEGYEEDGVLRFGYPNFLDIPDSSRWYHEALPVDMDGDGDMDFVTTNHNGTASASGTSLVEWYENDGIPGEVSLTRHEIGEGGGALLTIHDVDEDGDQDIILPQYFGGESLVWMEQPEDPTGPWTKHVINDDTGRGFKAEVRDMNGDGRPDLVYVNHNHQLSDIADERTMGVYWWEIPDPSEVRELADWGASMTVIFEGFSVVSDEVSSQGAPGVFHTGDVNGDGLMDVSVSGDGDDGVYVFTQAEDGTFDEHVIDVGLTMAGDHHMADLDGDGDMDFIWAVFGESGLTGPESTVYGYIQD